MANEFLLIDSNLIDDIASATRSKNNAKVEYTTTQLATAISNLNPHSFQVPMQKFAISLFDSSLSTESQRMCTSITGGWGYAPGTGLNSPSYSKNTIDSSDNTLKIYHAYHAASFYTLNPINWQTYLDKGYTTLVFEIEDPNAIVAYNGTATSIQTQAAQKYKDIAAYISSDVKTGLNNTTSKTAATAFTSYVQTVQTQCVGYNSNTTTGGYTIMPNKWAMNFKNMLEQNTALKSGGYLSFSCTVDSSGGSYNTVKIKKIYII